MLMLPVRGSHMHVRQRRMPHDLLATGHFDYPLSSGLYRRSRNCTVSCLSACGLYRRWGLTCYDSPRLEDPYAIFLIVLFFQKFFKNSKKYLRIFQFYSIVYSCRRGCWNWQTRTVQVRVVAIPCGFDSHLLHCRISGRATGVSSIC